MKRTIIILVLLAAITISTYPAYAGAEAYDPAREAMITYTGSEAFTKLTKLERKACTEWLIHGGEMSEKCSKAVMKLVSLAPDEVTAEQRQALIAEASGYDTAAQTQPQTEEPPQIVKKEDNTGKYIAIGLLGVLAGLVIHNNVGHSKPAPSYTPPAPPRHEPPHRNSPQHVSRPPQQRQPQHVSRPVQRQPQPQHRPQPRPVSRPVNNRPPHR